MTNLKIPETIVVGFNKRSDTYTGKLGYVIYKEKGKLKKEKSWNYWRDKEIDPSEFQNVPTEGFVLNRDVGGKRHSYSSWDVRMEKVRIYDPRGFEFEITLPNLLFILQECNSSRGKGIEGKFVYSWNKTELFLLPVNCQEYQESLNYTKRLDKKLDKTLLKEGYVYQNKEHNKTFIYLGNYIVWNIPKWFSKPDPKGKKSFVFALLVGSDYEFVSMSSASNLELLSDVKHEKYDEYLNNFLSNKELVSGITRHLFTGKGINYSFEKNTGMTNSIQARFELENYWNGLHDLHFWVMYNGIIYRGKTSGGYYQFVGYKIDRAEFPAKIILESKFLLKDGEICTEPLENKIELDSINGMVFGNPVVYTDFGKQFKV